MFKSSKSLLVTSVLVLTALVIILCGCEKQAAKSGTQMKTDSKTCLAGKVADANAVKTCQMKDKKPCCVKKDAKCKAADPNAMKTCPMKGKKPCCAKKALKCKAADANDVNSPAKQIK